MAGKSGDARERRSLTSTILADVHFWIPVVVLVAGIVVLRWIS